MSVERERRLRKIAELRQRELDDRARELGAARTHEVEARERLESARALVLRATEQRKVTVERGTNPEDWARAEHWIETLRRREQAAAEHRAAAAAATEHARIGVLAAQAALERMQRVVDKVAQLNRVAGERKERKLEDEFAAQRALAQRDPRGR